MSETVSLTSPLNNKQFRLAMILRPIELRNQKHAPRGHAIQKGLDEANKKFPPMTLIHIRQTDGTVWIKDKKEYVISLSKFLYKVSYKEIT